MAHDAGTAGIRCRIEPFIAASMSSLGSPCCGALILNVPHGNFRAQVASHCLHFRVVPPVVPVARWQFRNPRTASPLSPAARHDGIVEATTVVRSSACITATVQRQPSMFATRDIEISKRASHHGERGVTAGVPPHIDTDAALCGQSPSTFKKTRKKSGFSCPTTFSPSLASHSSRHFPLRGACKTTRDPVVHARRQRPQGVPLSNNGCCGVQTFDGRYTAGRFPAMLDHPFAGARLTVNDIGPDGCNGG